MNIMNKSKRMYCNYKYFLFVILSFFVTVANAQKGNTIRGIVTDGDNEPLIGVSILETGTNNGVITDLDGRYIITLAQNESSLRFSYIGYNTQVVKIENRNSVNVKLNEDVVGLEEVIITGYGTGVTKDKLTAAISKVPTDRLESGIHSNPLTALYGAVTGVRVTQASGQPGSTPDIQIRAGASLSGSGSPLYIIDGVQKDNLVDINSNDIESIEILKDAAATALYGARANNGVVLVTTKSGKVGKASVSLKVNVGRNYLRETYKFLNTADYLYWERLASHRAGKTNDLMNGYNIGWGAGHDPLSDGNVTGKGVFSTTFLTKENEFLLDYGWQSMQDPVSEYQLLFKEFRLKDVNIQESWTQDYNLSISGGNDKGKYYSGLGYYKETGFPHNTGYDRFSFNFNGEYKVKDWFKSSGFMNFSKSSTNPNVLNNDANFFSVVMAAPPTFKGHNLDGSAIKVVNNNQNANMAETADSFYRRNDHYRLTLGTSANFDITRGLSLRLNALWYLRMNERESFNKEYTTGPGKTNSLRNASAGYGRNLDQTYNAILNYKTSFDLHSLDVIGGFEMIDKESFNFAGSGRGATSDDFINLQYTEVGETRDISSYHQRERIMSSFTNATYDYDSKYLFSFSGRYDGYSRLIDNRWGFFPGISGAWNVYREDFMKEYLDKISYLKIRAGYGQNGNVSGIGGNPYVLQGDYGTTPNYNMEYGILINQLPYPSLRWEKTTSFDTAIEIGLWDKVSISAGYFNKKTTDLITRVNLPTSAGVGNILTNNGNVGSQGFELEANYKIINTKDFKWSVGATATYVTSKVLKLPENGNDKNRQNGYQVYTGNGDELMWVGGYAEGESYGDIYGPQMMHVIQDENDLKNYENYVDQIPRQPVYGPAAYAKLSESQKRNVQQLAPGDAVWKDVNGDNIIDSYDRVKLGNLVPKWMGGFNTKLDYKGLTLSAVFDYALNYMKWNSGLQYFMGLTSNHFNAPEIVKKTWTEENTTATLPVFINGDSVFKQNYTRSNNSLFWEDASYLALREVTLSYGLPKAYSNSILMEKITVSLTGQNLIYFTGTKVFTPEYGSGQNDKGGYPLPISVFMGVNLTF